MSLETVRAELVFCGGRGTVVGFGGILQKGAAENESLRVIGGLAAAMRWQEDGMQRKRRIGETGKRRIGERALELLEERRMLATIYVDAGATGAVKDGKTWDSAFVDLQAGLAAAKVGDRVWVAGGTYKPTTEIDRTVSFALKSGVELSGGYAGAANAGNPDARDVALYQTVLSGDIGKAGDESDNSYHVVVGSGTDTTAILDGFTVTGGIANGTSSPSNSGGGMYNSSGSPTIRNCTFSGNSASYDGGGMYNDSSSPTVTNCTFSENTASYSGGGMSNVYSSSPTLTNCTFSGNTACGFGTASYDGGGMYNSHSSPTLTNCTFSGNTAHGFGTASYGGGGMYNSYSSPTLTNCIFSGNWACYGAGGSGGGMYNSYSSPTLANCTFSENVITYGGSGGGVYNSHSSPTLTNCTFSGNTADNGDGGGDGGGMANYNYSSPTLTNCIFSGNMADGGDDGGDGGSGGGMSNWISSSPTLTNCTFSGNTASYYGGGMSNVYSSSPTLTNCTFSGNTAGNGGGMSNGMYFSSYDDSSPTLTNCTFSGNSARDYYGGGVANEHGSSPTLANCTFSGNTAGYAGGGMYNFNSSSPTLTNCTFSGNTAIEYGGAMVNWYSSSPTLTNCILWGNTAASGAQIYNSIMITYSNIQDGWAGTGNTNVDPLFVRNPSPGTDGKWGTADDDYGDLRLQAGSPCIDVGDNASVPPLVNVDLDGRARIVDYPGVHDPGAIVDMGAYERQAGVMIGGTNGNDTFYARVNLDEATVDIWAGAKPEGEPIFQHPRSSVESCVIDGGGGDDTLILDFSNGAPLVGFIGGEGQDTLVLAGTHDYDGFGFEAGRVQ